MPYRSLEPLKIAFIGGSIDSAVGHTHFNAARLDGHFQIEAGCFSRNTDSNVSSAYAYGVLHDRLYSDWQSLLVKEKARLDAIVVLTPTPSHASIVIEAVKAGFPIICEKSLATSVQECDLIEQSVRENCGYLAVTFNYSGYPMVRELRSMICEGKLGSIQQIHIEMPQEGFLRQGANPQPWRTTDYVIPTVSLDLGVHVHHLINFLTAGVKPVRLAGDQVSFGRHSGLIDNVYLMAEYQGNLRVHAWWGKTALGHRNGLRVRVFGSKGSAEWFQMDSESLHFFDDNGRHLVIDRGSIEAKTANDKRYNRFKVGHPSGFIEAFANLYADIAFELRQLKTGYSVFGDCSYVYGASHAKNGLVMMEAIDYAAKHKAWINVDDILE